MPPESCPNCGADVPRNAKACPECGSDETTGWSDDAHASNLGLPDDEFDYGQFVQRELNSNTLKPLGITWYWWLTALLLVIILGVLFLR